MPSPTSDVLSPRFAHNDPKGGNLIRLLIAEDEPVARFGLCGMLAGTGVEIVCQAADCEQAIRYALSCDVDVVLLDLRMNGKPAFPVIERIKREKPGVRILVFSASDNLADMTQARDLGADGYLCKTSSRDEIVRAIQKSDEGRTAWTREQRRRFKNLLKARAVEPAGIALTPQELRVLAQVAAGLTNEEIAEQFAVSIETVKQHLKHILAKLHLEDRTQAAIWAIRNGVG